MGWQLNWFSKKGWIRFIIFGVISWLPTVGLIITDFLWGFILLAIVILAVATPWVLLGF